MEGDQHSEDMLTDIRFPAYRGKRSLLVESVFEYGPRVGCWRLLRIFKRFDVKVSILGVVRGMLMYPELTRAFVEEGHEIVSHGWRWLDYCQTSEDEEREHVRLAVKGIKKEADWRAAGRLVQRSVKHQHPAAHHRARGIFVRPERSGG